MVSCCACQETEATVFRRCGHCFCARCVLEFVGECREDYCDKDVIRLNPSILRQYADLAEQEVLTLETQIIRDLEEVQQRKDAELEAIVREHNRRFEREMTDRQRCAKSELEKASTLLKKFEASQMVSESVELIRGDPLAASLDLKEDAFYKLSELEASVEGSSPFCLLEIVTDRVGMATILRGKIGLCLDDGQGLIKFKTSLGLFRGGKKIVSGKRVECRPRKYSKWGLITIGVSEHKDAYFDRRFQLLLIHNKQDQTLTVSLDGSTYSGWDLKAAGMCVREPICQIIGDLYKICAKPPVYILADKQGHIIPIGNSYHNADHQESCKLDTQYHYIKTKEGHDERYFRVPR